MTAKEQSLCNVQELGFALNDLSLYLDTHPSCVSGLTLYQSLHTQYLAAAAAYETAYGPLTLWNAVRGDRWLWAEEPMPWEVDC